MRIKDYACIDLEREKRTGIPEVVLAEGKEQTHLINIVRALVEKNGRAIVTRASAPIIKAVSKLPYEQERHDDAGLIILKKPGFKVKSTGGIVGVLSAGTSDYKVAQEAQVVAEQLGCKVVSAHDVGVAGIHRLFEALDRMDGNKVDVFIVVAGREGALPTLVAGMVDAPVIGVPVSTGYGMAGRGKSALYAMLQSCSPLVVVNIDAGFVAGAVAAQIARRRRRA